MWPDWYERPFPLAAQARVDAESAAIAALQPVGDDATVRLIAHPRYVDAELLDASSFSVIRARDLQMTYSARLRGLLDSRGFELITHRDI